MTKKSQAQTEVWTVSDEDAGDRIDKFLSAIYDEFSRVAIQRYIREGKVTCERHGNAIEGLRVSESLSEGDKVSFELPPPEEDSILQAEEIDLDVIFEDDDILVINKSAGLVVHPGAGIHEGTLVNALLGYDEKTFRKMDDQRPGIVHRLDKETSGVLIIAKNAKAKQKLVKKFASRHVDKFYLALVRGHIRMGRGTLETWIGRSKENRLKMKSLEDEEESEGKHAITHYKVLAQNKGASLLKVKIETGRTHQIRVHMSEMGFPVIGDKVYGKKRLEMSTSPERHILHAWRLKIDHPISGEAMTFTAPLPESFTSILDKFGIDIKK